MNSSNHICGEEHAQWLDNRLRYLIHNPYSMFKNYVNPGATVFDIGCGPGTFTLGLAQLIGPQGHLVAVDLQEGMLDRTRKKIINAQLEKRVTFHQCQNDQLNLSLKADFILTFYMVHETPHPISFIDEICTLLKPGGIYYLAEPKVHVSRTDYQEMIKCCQKNGLSLIKQQGFISRIAIFQKI